MWEVAARAQPANDDSHKTWPWFFGETSDDIGLYAWLPTRGEYSSKPVGSYLPNEWGLYDVYGNVIERCLDASGWLVPSGVDHYSQKPGQIVENGLENFRRVLGYPLYSDEVNGRDVDRDVYGNWMGAATNTNEFYGARLAIVCLDEGSAPPVTITWKDDEGNTLKTTSVPFATTPSYSDTGEIPEKPSTTETSYFFQKWVPAVDIALENTTYTGVFTSFAHQY